MNRFFINKEEIVGGRARIFGEDAKHIASVLRLSRGDELLLCDGGGQEYPARIEAADKESVRVEILSQRRAQAEPRTRVTLFQGLPKAGKLETIIQKCVELGVSSIVPVLAKRSVVRLTGGEFEPKRARYRRVAYEAAKQSGRGVVPEIGALIEIDKIDPAAFDAFFVPYEGETEQSLKQALRKFCGARNVGVAIGPEGGFDPEEVRMLKEKGAQCVTLGPRILRTETAGPAVVAMLLYEWEDDA